MDICSQQGYHIIEYVLNLVDIHDIIEVSVPGHAFMLQSHDVWSLITTTSINSHMQNI